MKKFFGILFLLLPVLAALGYDAYIQYNNPDQEFLFSDLGWIWQHHHQESHDQFYEMVGQENWGDYIAPILSLYAVIVGCIISGIIVLLLMLVKIFTAAANSGFAGNQKQSSKLGRARDGAKKFEYKRK